MKVTGRTLVVEDESGLLQVVVTMLERAGHEVVGVGSLSEALLVLKDEEFDVVLSDLMLGGESGFDLLKWMRAEKRSEPLIVMSAFGTIERAVQALRGGAFEFVEKPFDQAELLVLISKAISFSRSRTGSHRIEGLSAERLLDSRVPEVQKISALFSDLKRDHRPEHVLIFWGESGSGCELLAREALVSIQGEATQIYEWSTEGLNDAQIEEDLEGSSRRPGILSWLKDGASLLIHAKSLESNSTLLRALESAKDSKGALALVLQQRPNVPGHLAIKVPSLSERTQDFEGLSRSVFAAVANRLNAPEARISEQVISHLFEKIRTTNLIELARLFERAIQAWVSGDKARPNLGLEYFSSEHQRSEEASLSLKERVRARSQEFERQVILDTLKAESGNITRSSERLGLSRRGLQLKMKELGIERSDAWGS